MTYLRTSLAAFGVLVLAAQSAFAAADSTAKCKKAPEAFFYSTGNGSKFKIDDWVAATKFAAWQPPFVRTKSATRYVVIVHERPAFLDPPVDAGSVTWMVDAKNFGRYDRNEDGRISRLEFDTVLAVWFRKQDKDRNAVLCATETTPEAVPVSYLPRWPRTMLFCKVDSWTPTFAGMGLLDQIRNIREAPTNDKMDVDDDGAVDRAELNLATRLLFLDLDGNDDGFLSVEEIAEECNETILTASLSPRLRFQSSR